MARPRGGATRTALIPEGSSGSGPQTAGSPDQEYRDLGRGRGPRISIQNTLKGTCEVSSGVSCREGEAGPHLLVGKLRLRWEATSGTAPRQTDTRGEGGCESRSLGASGVSSEAAFGPRG